jgi:hypothetical protein
VDEPDGLVELADAIDAVRQQLIAAQARSRRIVAGQVLTFAVGTVQIEFSGEVRKTLGGDAKAEFYVVSLGGSGERATTATHKVSVELVPRAADGGDFLVSDPSDTPPPAH